MLLVVGHKLFRDALATIINQSGDVQIFAELGKAEAAIEICRREAPDLVVMTDELEAMGGIEATQDILRLRPETKVILLLSSQDESSMSRAIRSGAVGIIYTSSSVTNVMDALRTVQQGRCYFGPTAWNLVVHRVRQMRTESHERLEHLSPQDRQLLGFIIQGKTTKQIAATLGVTEGALSSRREKLKRKMGVKNTAALIMLALARGFEEK